MPYSTGKATLKFKLKILNGYWFEASFFNKININESWVQHEKNEEIIHVHITKYKYRNSIK